MYPVENRSAETLLPLIQRHFEPASTIYSDGWTAYCSLNELGYKHFIALHKYTFKKLYKNTETGEITAVHTNRIEGAWKHAKDHFRAMAGTKAPQWEGHLAEIMWRSEAKSNMYTEFFDLLTAVYTLESPPQYFYTTSLFDSWSGPSRTVLSETTIEPQISDTESDADVQTETENIDYERNAQVKETTGSVVDPVVISSDEDFHEQSNSASRDQTLRPETVQLSQLLSELFSESSSDENDGTEEVNAGIIKSHTVTQTSRSKEKPSSSTEGRQQMKDKSKNKGLQKKTKTDNVCHPKGFIPLKKKFTSTGKAPKNHEKSL